MGFPSLRYVGTWRLGDRDDYVLSCHETIATQEALDSRISRRPLAPAPPGMDAFDCLSASHRGGRWKSEIPLLAAALLNSVTK